MKCQIMPSCLSGSVVCPPAKAVLHRAIICSALSGGRCFIDNYAPCDDVSATLGVLSAAGFEYAVEGSRLIIRPCEYNGGHVMADCRESGSTLRFLIPVLGALGIPTTFIGRGRLCARPMDIYEKLMPLHGLSLSRGVETLPLKMEGRLTGGRFCFSGGVSSQFVSGLLMALPQIKESGSINLTSPLESMPYVAMTIDMMAKFGAEVRVDGDAFYVEAGQSYRPADIVCEGDWSAAVFFMAAGLLGGDIKLLGLRTDTAQGDAAALGVFSALGADIKLDDGVAVHGGYSCGTTIDASNIPDMVPAICVAAAFAEGQTTHIINAGRLRLKESDRLAACAENLRRLGCCVVEEETSLHITGIDRSTVNTADLCGFNDHRIVMAFAMALSAAGGGTISDMNAVEKSYPAFWEHFSELGGKYNVV